MYRGPAELSKGALVVDATYDNATKLGVVYADLEANGLQIADAV